MIYEEKPAPVPEEKPGVPKILSAETFVKHHPHHEHVGQMREGRKCPMKKHPHMALAAAYLAGFACGLAASSLLFALTLGSTKE